MKTVAQIIAPKHKEFQLHFNSKDIFRDESLSLLTKQYQLDIVALDDWCIEHHGYDIEKQGSLADFITMKFGIEALNFINSIM